MLFVRIFSICACLAMSVSSSSWCLGKAAVCDCGTPKTFLLLFWCNCNCHYKKKVPEVSLKPNIKMDINSGRRQLLIIFICPIVWLQLLAFTGIFNLFNQEFLK